MDMRMRKKQREAVQDPGARVIVADLLLENVTTDEVGSVQVFQDGFEARVVGHGFVAIGTKGLGRGQLSSVKVVQLEGDAVTFEAMVMDRIQEMEYIGNRIWGSNAVIPLATEYAEGYGFPYGSAPAYGYGEAGGYGTPVVITLNVIEADALALDYENRTSFRDDFHEIYVKVNPTGGTVANKYHFKLTVVPMA